MIKNIVFDIGAVLIAFDWDAYMEKLFADAVTRRHVTDAMWHNPDWNALDRGAVPLEDAIAQFVENDPEYEAEIRLAMKRLGEAPEKQPYAIPWIHELKAAGYRVFYLSNYFEYLMREAPQVLDFIPYTDGGIFSCHEKITKPEPELYRRLFERYDLKAEESIFIDDSPRNTEAAEALGMKSFRFTDYAETYPAVMRYLQEY